MNYTFICSIGKACFEETTQKEMLNLGMTHARFNFSHVNNEEGKKELKFQVKQLRKISDKLDKKIYIIQDLCGAKVRINISRDLIIKKFNKFILSALPNKEGFLINYPSIIPEIKTYLESNPKLQIFLNDGKVILECIDANCNNLYCLAKTDGILRKGLRGVNFRGFQPNLPVLTEKDISDLEFGINNLKTDVIMIPFVRKGEDILYVKNIVTQIKKIDYFPKIWSKIETEDAISNLDDIIKNSDAVVVARGDLGANIGIEKLPVIQKKIIEKGKLLNKEIIVATQFLPSIVEGKPLTRPDACDIAWLAYMGVKKILFTYETAYGKPIEVMKIAKEILDNVFEDQG